MKPILHSSLALCCVLSLSVMSAEYELKHTSKVRSDKQEIEYEYENGVLEEIKYRDKVKKSHTVLLTGKHNVWHEHFYLLPRLGYHYESTKDEKYTLDNTGALDKNKTRDENEKSPFFGLGTQFRWYDLLYADIITNKSYIDLHNHYRYSANNLASDAKDYSGGGKLYEFKSKLDFEYSTPLMDVFIIPSLQYRHRQYSSWYDKIRDKNNDEQVEKKYKALIWFNYITPIDGIELLIAPAYEYEKEQEGNEVWESTQSRLLYLKFEIEEANPGFEAEVQFSYYYSGHNQGRKALKLELSYEF